MHSYDFSKCKVTGKKKIILLNCNDLLSTFLFFFLNISFVCRLFCIPIGVCMLCYARITKLTAL